MFLTKKWNVIYKNRERGFKSQCDRLGDILAFDALSGFVTATFFLGMHFLPVAVVLSGWVKQVTTVP